MASGELITRLLRDLKVHEPKTKVGPQPAPEPELAPEPEPEPEPALRLALELEHELEHEPEAGSMHEPDHLRFDPSANKVWLRDTFNDIPRYLFRVYSPQSSSTDMVWAMSRDAEYRFENRRVDIFARDDQQVAAMLNDHLRWHSGSDNFVSWTSSLLYALQYIFHLHCNPKDRSSFDMISLCVIDTTSLPRGVFLRDMDLIEAYRWFDGDLNSFGNLRQQGVYYFGEYLLQGALRIEGNCGIVTAQVMIDNGLLDLQPDFKDFTNPGKVPRPSWAKEVVRLRQDFRQDSTARQQITQEEVQAAMRIAREFGPRWRLPMAANLIAILPRRDEDGLVLSAFRSPSFEDSERLDCSPLTTKIAAYDTLPEVQRFDDIMRSVCWGFCITTGMNIVKDAEALVHNARTCITESETTLAGRNLSKFHDDREVLTRVIHMVERVGQDLRDIIANQQDDEGRKKSFA